MLSGVSRKVTSAALALALCASSSIASATSAPVSTSQISPMVALSIFGSQASASALCGASGTNATASAAMVQAPVGGCVLPVVDAPPPVPVAQAAPLVSVPVTGFGVAPILLGLAGIAVLAALIASQKSGNGNNPPISVN